MSNLSELLPTGGGQNAVDFVASGTLSSGQTVILKSDGTVEAVSGTPEALSSEVSFESGSTEMTTVCYDKNTNKIFVAYVDNGNSEYGTMCVGTVSGSSISFGTPVVFFSYGTQYPAACYWEDQNKVFLAYASKATPFNYAGFCHMISISGTVPTANTSYTFANSGTYHTAVSYDSTAQRVLICWMDASSSYYGKARVAYIVTGIQIGFGTETTFNSQTTQEIFSAHASSTIYSVVVYQGGSSQGKARVIGISGNSAGVNAEYTFNAAITYNPRIAYDPDNQNFIIAYKDAGNSNKGTACIGTISGTALSFSAEQVFADYACDWPALSYDTTNNQMVLSYQNNAVSNRLEVRTISSDGSTLSFGDPLNVGANIMYTSSAFDPDTGKTVVTYRGTNGKSVVYSPLVTNVSNCIGITAEAISDTATGAVNVYGGINEAQTGLTIGSDYYVDSTGAISASPPSIGKKLGKAISATTLNLLDYPSITYAPGQQAFTTAGTYSWVAPAGVTSVSVVAVGGGGAGASGSGGGGGELRYKNNISVSPGSSYTVVVGSGGGSGGTFAGSSSFNGSDCVANGGQNASSGSSTQAGGSGGIGDGGGNGGTGAGAASSYGSGGGAGGYSGNGGNGGNNNNHTAGTGGAGGGGASYIGSDYRIGYGGGGVGILGEGSSAAKAGSTNVNGGSGGANGGGDGTNANGGLYGGGSGSATPTGTVIKNGQPYANGAVRIIWGSNRAFPSTNTGDL